MDVPTIILLLSIGSFVFALLLIIFQFVDKNSSRIPFWVLAKFLQGTGSLFLYFENSTSFLVHILFSHTVILIGCAYEAWAILFLLGKSVSRKAHIFITLSIIVICILSAIFNPFSRSSAIFLVNSALYAIPAWFLFNKKEKSFLGYFLGICYFLVAVLYFIHAVQLLNSFNLHLNFSGEIVFHLMPIATFCLVLISGFSMLLLAIEKSSLELIKSRAEVQEKNCELMNLNMSKDRFFSIIAHDLKAPFQGLIGYSEMLCNDHDSLPDEERRGLSKGINELSLNTYKLLSNLLDWSGLQTGMLSCTPVKLQLDKELPSIISLFVHLARNKNISLEYTFNKTFFVIADRNMLATIIRNLISNPIKFTNAGGKVSIKVKESGDFTEIAISDTGVGMGTKKIDHLFKIDQKVNTKGTANEEGTGLGLLLCKEMIEKQNGAIWVESLPGKGTTFYFTLPRPA
ncbi:MAG: sensor histidine kinase [Syntrophothermus sp.]